MYWVIIFTLAFAGALVWYGLRPKRQECQLCTGEHPSQFCWMTKVCIECLEFHPFEQTCKPVTGRRAERVLLERTQRLYVPPTIAEFGLNRHARRAMKKRGRGD